MIMIINLNKDTYNKIQNELPRLIERANPDTINIDGGQLFNVHVNNSAIMKTSGNRDEVTFDLGGHLIDIKKCDFESIAIF